MDRADRLGTEKIGRLLWQFSLPAMVAIVAEALYNVVDRIFIGQAVGIEGIAAITVTFPFQLIVMALGMLVGVGANSLYSIRLGEQRRDEAARILGCAFTLFLLMDVIIITLGLVFTEPLLRAFGASDSIVGMAADYMRIILLGITFSHITHGMNSFIRGEGNPRVAMGTTLIASGANIVLDPIFIFGFGMGVKGAALATILGQAVGAVWVVWYFVSGAGVVGLKRENIRVRWDEVRQFLPIGMTPFLVQLTSSLMHTVLNHQLVRYSGEAGLSIGGIVFSIMMFFVIPVMGSSMGLQPIAVYIGGGLNFRRVRRALILGLASATLITCGAFIVIHGFAPQIAGLFINDDTVFLSDAVHAIHIFFSLLCVVGFQVVGSQYFLAVGRPRIAMFLGLTRRFIFILPMFMIFPIYWGSDGIWMAGPAADLLSLMLTVFFVWRELGHLQVKPAQ